MSKPSRGFPLQYRLLIAFTFERGAGAKLSRGFPLQYYLFVALVFEKVTLARLSRRPYLPLECKTVGSRGQSLRIPSSIVNPL